MRYAWISADEPAPEAMAIRWLAGHDNWSMRTLLSRQPIRPDDLLLSAFATGHTLEPGTQYAAGPVLCLNPDLSLLAYAMRVAADQPLAVVEAAGMRVRGWAAACGALDLAADAPTPPADPEIARALVTLGDTGPHAVQHGSRDYIDAVAVLDAADTPRDYVRTYLLAREVGGSVEV
ncbi:hypothetical protein ACWEKT_16400 [Nocardia takedensis]|uniref:hypothetical protein n=1 Tax=Nocardia takedensis TaxID=259390 RepID=UPI0002D75920|nr:hypothetical protein [Nocardia takedensis]